MLDYLDWRGDLPFSAAAFNEVDALICAWLSYYEWDGLLQTRDYRGETTLGDWGRRHLAVIGPAPKLNLNFTLDPAQSAALLLTRACDTVRFGGMRLVRFREVFDEGAGVQFAAVSLEADAAPHIIAYRGTDTSLAGWKEDFELSYLTPVPAQALAQAYLADEPLPQGDTLLCGHSKGGNLALYAALNGPEEKLARVSRVYDFDGPGFRIPMEEMPRYRQARDKIIAIVPQSSIVGMLLEHPEDYRTVKSDMVGVLQHNGMLWHVQRDRFVDVEGVNLSSVVVDKTMEEWLGRLSLKERQEAVQIVFSVLETTGVRHYTDLTDHAVKNILLLIKGASQLSWEQKKLAFRLIFELIRAQNLSVYEAVTHSAWVTNLVSGVNEKLDQVGKAVRSITTREES